MRFRPAYGSHIPVLIWLLQHTQGDVLEMGGGLHSTPLLHWMCVANKRHLYTYDNDPQYTGLIKQFDNEYHHLFLVDDWDKAPIERLWSFALIDHAPGERRPVDALRLKDWAHYIAIHDSSYKDDKHYHYKAIYPQFKWRYDYKTVSPNTTILSNFQDLSGLVI